MTDYDEIRTCCSGGDVCRVCWDFMTVAIKVVHKTLTDDFGFKNLLWVYSGRRGVHCWVCDERARKMPSEGRRAIVSFLEVIKGGENAGRKTNLPKSLHPSLRRAYEVLVPHFRKTVVEGMQVLSVRDHWTKLLALVPDEDVRKRLDQQWSTRERSNESRWEDLVSELNSKKKSLYNVERDIIFQYTYPRLDSNVSIGLNHLLKAPFCVHPKTGKVCVPMDPDRCEEFDPMDVPTLESVLNDEGTSKRIGVERFCKVFLRGVGEEVRRGLKERNILEF
ncbi:DNA primase subunit PRI1 [Spizellomyces punctatus DAOM BR117]|uniref:DNA primase small subunit n=1 Tax=Spizellomyces punctatus (strain DAOM BR117) TaxID=645134 RepID=A0A0L0HHE1_SPIPD|nr:DNA primase subunit PRI1 [Spizellomyces punctatus DAOM BR117]KND00533.1 hypothetical protein SPPG_04843 [Spizellomyces punctatus DAOM BR117]|eukprot:XP_016608572.1 hypothetical protein SPPG_04843 [Spizellomyces punctatus DAOM BR117]